MVLVNKFHYWLDIQIINMLACWVGKASLVHFP
jgi:hypothetical protein